MSIEGPTISLETESCNRRDKIGSGAQPFEAEYPEAASILAKIYAESPRYYRAGAMRYLPKHWHFTVNGECLELSHRPLR